MAPDGRRIGQAQRRRIGAPSNVYSDTMKQPTHSVGDIVRAKGRYGDQRIDGIYSGMTRPQEGTDGHGYLVSGGKGGRRSLHLSGDLRSIPPCTQCGGKGGADYSDPDYSPETHGSALCPACGGKGY